MARKLKCKKINEKRKEFYFQQYESTIGKYVPFTQETICKTDLFNLENEWVYYVQV